MKVIEFKLRITKIIDHLTIPNENLQKSWKSKKIQRENLENHENLRNPCESYENHKNLWKQNSIMKKMETI